MHESWLAFKHINYDTSSLEMGGNQPIDSPLLIALAVVVRKKN